MFGLFAHALGILGDGSFAIRVYVKKAEWFRSTSVYLVTFYTLVWTGWLIWLHIVLFNHTGRVCSGAYLESTEDSFKLTGGKVMDGYALQQARILYLTLLIVYAANGAIFVI